MSKKYKVIIRDIDGEGLDIAILNDIFRDYLVVAEEIEEIKEIKESLPAEYACPRCGSNVSTHICMKAEPVAGETKPWHDGHEWVGVNAAPSVAIPITYKKDLAGRCFCNFCKFECANEDDMVDHIIDQHEKEQQNA